MTTRPKSAGAVLAVLTMIAFMGCAKSVPEPVTPATDSAEASTPPESEAAADAAAPANDTAAAPQRE